MYIYKIIFILNIAKNNINFKKGRRGTPAAAGAAAAGPPAATARAEDLELPDRVAVAGGPSSPVHPYVAAGACDVQRLRSAGARRRRVDRVPGRTVG